MINIINTPALTPLWSNVGLDSTELVAGRADQSPEGTEVRPTCS